jgi:hypothetical protein
MDKKELFEKLLFLYNTDKIKLKEFLKNLVIIVKKIKDKDETVEIIYAPRERVIKITQLIKLQKDFSSFCYDILVNENEFTKVIEILKQNQKENIDYKENNMKIAYKNDGSNFAYEFFIDMLYKEDNLKKIFTRVFLCSFY